MSPFTSGALSLHLHKWQKFTTDPWILQAIQGYTIEFLNTPVKFFVPYPIKLSVEEQVIIDGTIFLI